MLTVEVRTRFNEQRITGVVELHGYDTLTARAARAALEIAGYFTGEAWTVAEGTPDGLDYSGVYGYRVYPYSTRKLHRESR